jgi:hypothetical protein
MTIRRQTMSHNQLDLVFNIATQRWSNVTHRMQLGLWNFSASGRPHACMRCLDVWGIGGVSGPGDGSTQARDARVLAVTCHTGLPGR